jgi:hypothetical protein
MVKIYKSVTIGVVIIGPIPEGGLCLRRVKDASMMQLSFSLRWVIVLIVSKQIVVVSLTYSV